jgi:heme/copper-type cytochrome/quinol oxidase subunit 4
MKINKQFYKDTFGWGFFLWLLGYILGIILFFALPKSMIGWIISPIATVVTLWVLIKKIQSVSFSYYFLIAISWTVIAVILDYFLLVKVLKPEDGYYKPDVYLYYTLTFILPLLVGLWKKKKAE